jgi:hypothetical protein
VIASAGSEVGAAVAAPPGRAAAEVVVVGVDQGAHPPNAAREVLTRGEVDWTVDYLAAAAGAGAGVESNAQKRWGSACAERSPTHFTELRRCLIFIDMHAPTLMPSNVSWAPPGGLTRLPTPHPHTQIRPQNVPR